MKTFGCKICCIFLVIFVVAVVSGCFTRNCGREKKYHPIETPEERAIHNYRKQRSGRKILYCYQGIFDIPIHLSEKYKYIFGTHSVLCNHAKVMETAGHLMYQHTWRRYSFDRSEPEEPRYRCLFNVNVTYYKYYVWSLFHTYEDRYISNSVILGCYYDKSILAYDNETVKSPTVYHCAFCSRNNCNLKPYIFQPHSRDTLWNDRFWTKKGLTNYNRKKVREYTRKHPSVYAKHTKADRQLKPRNRPMISLENRIMFQRPDMDLDFDEYYEDQDEEDQVDEGGDKFIVRWGSKPKVDRDNDEIAVLKTTYQCIPYDF